MVFGLNLRTGSENKIDFGMLAATLLFLLVDHRVSRASRGNQESVAIDLQGGPALHTPKSVYRRSTDTST
jgi:hypothetical protein